MPWSCLQCSTANEERVRVCASCGARMPFTTQPHEIDEVADTERFVVPRQGELTAHFRHNLDSLRAGTLSLEEFVERVRAAAANVPVIFEHLLDTISEEREQAPSYIEGVTQSLLDCQALFLSGIDQTLAYAEDGDDFHLRFGWLLIEKGEQEYIAIVETLRNDAGKSGMPESQDVLGRMVLELSEGRLEQEEYLRNVAEFETSALECLDRAQELILSSTEAARTFDGSSQRPLEESFTKASEAAEELGSLVLTLYHPG